MEHGRLAGFRAGAVAMIVAWLSGLARTRTGTVLGTVAGIAITVGFLVAIGAFMRSSAAEMTARATGDVPIDWQVELTPGCVRRHRRRRDAERRAHRPACRTLGYAATDGFRSLGGRHRPGHRARQGSRHRGRPIRRFPGQYPSAPRKTGRDADRPADGSQPPCGAGRQCHHSSAGIAGCDGHHRWRRSICRMPIRCSRRSACRRRGAAGTAGQCPSSADRRRGTSCSIRRRVLGPIPFAREIHARLDRANLASDPQAAFLAVTGEGHNFEARVAGSALLANNLAQDPRYDQGRCPLCAHSLSSSSVRPVWPRRCC